MQKWLFRSENCDAYAVFCQKMAARRQGQKKNYVQLRFDLKAERTQKGCRKINKYLKCSQTQFFGLSTDFFQKRPRPQFLLRNRHSPLMLFEMPQFKCPLFGFLTVHLFGDVMLTSLLFPTEKFDLQVSHGEEQY